MCWVLAEVVVFAGFCTVTAKMPGMPAVRPPPLMPNELLFTMYPDGDMSVPECRVVSNHSFTCFELHFSSMTEALEISHGQLISVHVIDYHRLHEVERAGDPESLREVNVVEAPVDGMITLRVCMVTGERMLWPKFSADNTRAQLITYQRLYEVSELTTPRTRLMFETWSIFQLLHRLHVELGHHELDCVRITAAEMFVPDHVIRVFVGCSYADLSREQFDLIEQLLTESQAARDVDIDDRVVRTIMRTPCRRGAGPLEFVEVETIDDDLFRQSSDVVERMSRVPHEVVDESAR